MSEEAPSGRGGEATTSADGVHDDAGYDYAGYVGPLRNQYSKRFRLLRRSYRPDFDKKPVLGWKIGDQVRVVSLSPFIANSTEATGIYPHTIAIFHNIIGRTLRIDNFVNGELELNVFKDGSQANNYCENTILLEPECAVFMRRSPVLPSEWTRIMSGDGRRKRLVTVLEWRNKRGVRRGVRRYVRQYSMRNFGAS